MRSRLLPLALTAAMVFGAVLTGPASASPAAGARRSSEHTAGRPPLNRTLARLVLSPAQASIRAGTSQTYTATGYDPAGHDLGDLTAQTSFSIGPDGSCTGASCTATNIGRHTITGTVALGHRTISGTAALQVVVPPGPVAPSRSPVAPSPGPVAPSRRQVGHPQSLPLLELRPARAFISSGESLTYTAWLVAADGSRENVTDQTTFSIRFSAAKTSHRIRPDGSCTGAICTATKLGRHTVTGTLDLGGSTISGTAALQVVPRHRRMGRPRPLVRLELRPPTATIRLSQSQDYTAIGTATDGSKHNVTAGTTFTFQQQDGTPSGACPNATCTPPEAGSYTITGRFTQPGGSTLTATATLLVLPGDLAGLELHPNPDPAVINPGGKVTYIVHGLDASGRHLDQLGDLAAFTSFGIDRGGSCTGPTCTATDLGPYTVTGTLATTGGRILATTSLKIERVVPPWPRWLLFVIGVLLLLVLAVLAFLGERARRQRRWVRQHLRVEPHPSPGDATVDQDPQTAPTVSVRLQPHGDAGTQTLKEGD